MEPTSYSNILIVQGSMALQCIFSLLVFLLSTCTATPMVKSPNIPWYSPYETYSPYNVAPPPAAVPTTTVGTQTTSTVPMNTVGARTQVTSTCGGSAKGAPCVFPFTYKGIMYTKCTPIDHDEPWCSTESVYESQWGNCNCPGELCSSWSLSSSQSCRARWAYRRSRFA